MNTILHPFGFIQGDITQSNCRDFSGYHTRQKHPVCRVVYSFRSHEDAVRDITNSAAIRPKPLCKSAVLLLVEISAADLTAIPGAEVADYTSHFGNSCEVVLYIKPPNPFASRHQDAVPDM